MARTTPSATDRAGTSLPVACELLTPLDVADLLKVSKRTVFRLRASGLLPAPLELGTNLIRWRAEDIRRFVDDMRERRVRPRTSRKR